MFKSWTVGDKLVLVQEHDVLGHDGPTLDRVIFRPISDNAARLQALQTR